MATCRDDLLDGATAGDATFARDKSGAGDGARLGDRAFITLRTLATDGADAGDGAGGNKAMFAQDGAKLAESSTSTLHALSLVEDGAQALDEARFTLRLLFGDGVQGSDGSASATATLLVDGGAAADSASGPRTARGLIRDAIQAADQASIVWRSLSHDGAQGTDGSGGRARAKTLLDEGLKLTETSLSAASLDALCLDSARAQDGAWVQALHAKTLIHEGFWIDDEALQSGDWSLAWTANTSNWAMSRYAPFTASGLAVIDGVVYACADDGVYALDGASEAISAKVRTAALDASGSTLAHPVQSLLHCAMDSAAKAEVQIHGMQQHGLPGAWRYQVAKRPPLEHLGPARAQFGRGLRARHMAIALEINGTSASLVDWSLLMAPSKRNI